MCLVRILSDEFLLESSGDENPTVERMYREDYMQRKVKSQYGLRSTMRQILPIVTNSIDSVFKLI